MTRWGVKMWRDEYVEVEASTESDAIIKAKGQVDFYASDYEAEELDTEEPDQ